MAGGGNIIGGAGGGAASRSVPETREPIRGWPGPSRLVADVPAS